MIKILSFVILAQFLIIVSLAFLPGTVASPDSWQPENGVVEPAASTAASTAASIGPNRYVGSDACDECHKKQFKKWKKRPHSRAFSKLKGKARKNPKCLKCHTTAYGEKTGFVDTATTPHHALVGCEACHGPGGAHVDALRKNEKAREMKIEYGNQARCASCHKYHSHYGKKRLKR